MEDEYPAFLTNEKTQQLRNANCWVFIFMYEYRFHTYFSFKQDT